MFRRLWTTALVIVAFVGVGYCGLTYFVLGPLDDEPDLVFDRTWLTPIPEGEREFFHVMVVVRAQELGAFYKASAFRAEQELFEFEHEPNILKLRFPQTGRRAKIRYSVKTCDVLPPFELCLDLNRNPWGGPKRYYAFRDDEDAGRHGFGPFLNRLSPLLEQR
jgi:hypothetical protein